METLLDLMSRHGLAFVFVNVLLAQLGAPVPAMPTLVVAGALAAQGQIAPSLVLLVAVVASMLGDAPWYVAGRRYGYRILQSLCRFAIEPDSCVRQTEGTFERYGPSSIILAKYIPGFSTVAPPLAGAMQLGAGRFVSYSALAALLWAALPLALGMIFHAQVEQALLWLQDMGTGAAMAVGAALALYVMYKLARRYSLIRFLRMARIEPDELRALMQQADRPVVLDARSPGARRLDPRRIPGAIAVDINDPVIAAAAGDSDVIVYCS